MPSRRAICRDSSTCTALPLISARPSAEIPIVHAVNFAMFIALFAAFEYLLISILELVCRTRRSILGGSSGLAGIYAIFGFMALTMLPQELTTPDLLSGTCILGAFGALLRLKIRSEHDTSDAIINGLSI